MPKTDGGYRPEGDGWRFGGGERPLPQHPRTSGFHLLPGTDAHQREPRRHRAICQRLQTVQAANLEKGCSWIKLFIATPSLGFLGTVIGMVMSFDQIQQAGDISPTIVASGMKVALITTIFGIIVALILQVFYNYILSKVEHLTSQMEESAVTLMDIIAKSK